MTAKIITVFNQKGGAGKTTVALSVAGTLGLRGHKTLLVDLDPQGTASLSAGAAPDEQPFPATVVQYAVHPQPTREIRKFVDDYDFIVIDCPPAIQSSAPSVALLISDIGLIPVAGSAGNFWAVKEAKNLARHAQAQNETLRVRTVANMTKNRTISKNVFEALGKDTEFPLCASSLGDRAAYPEAEATGVAVTAMGSSAREAKRETNALVDEVLAIIGE
ncbi:AAA family ATPase [Cupriavidus basilensis]|uniref:AAA family ATPase n=1 Tax=Cupriavidus basilensis TaxID=68895 RepID=UPI0039F70BBA